MKAHPLLLQPSPTGCPYLLLAPMEGVGDRSFRKALSGIGGFDEAVTEFISVPSKASPEGLVKEYDAKELFPTPLAAQIMGTNGELMAQVAKLLEKKGAPRVDINCGCPSNTVTGRGAGSSLLKTPDILHQIVQTVKKEVSIPLTVKMRSGYQDTSLFKENLLAVQEAGASFITLHPRTKLDGYAPPANWDFIALAKEILSIPVVGNGDIVSKETALAMLKKTRCDALMIGRGAISNPFVFHEIRSHFTNTNSHCSWENFHHYLSSFLSFLPIEMPPKRKIGKLKQILTFFFQGKPHLFLYKQELLRTESEDPSEFLHQTLRAIKPAFSS